MLVPVGPAPGCTAPEGTSAEGAPLERVDNLDARRLRGSATRLSTRPESSSATHSSKIIHYSLFTILCIPYSSSAKGSIE